jgi:hypothetical protein
MFSFLIVTVCSTMCWVGRDVMFIISEQHCVSLAVKRKQGRPRFSNCSILRQFVAFPLWSFSTGGRL